MTNPLASQQPAPIPRICELHDEYMQSKEPASFEQFLAARIARLEAALRALRTYMWAEGYADQTAVMRQADAALGTPGREKP
jgi:hypothetical protein